MIKLIALDLDGTLLPENQQIQPATRQLLQRLAAEGMYLVLTSGRCYQSVRMVQEQAGILGQPMILHNGAIVKLPNEPSVVLDTVSIPLTRQLYELCTRRGWSISFVFGDGGKAFCNRADEFMLHTMTAYNRCTPEVDTTFTRIEAYCKEHEPPNKIFISADNMAQSSEIAQTIRRDFGNELGVYVAGERYVDVAPATVSKGKGLQRLAQRLGLDGHELMAIGDGENDIPMLKAAHVSVAMGNALDTVKRAAQHVTDSNEEEGVRKAIERLLLSAHT